MPASRSPEPEASFSYVCPLGFVAACPGRAVRVKFFIFFDKYAGCVEWLARVFLETSSAHGVCTWLTNTLVGCLFICLLACLTGEGNTGRLGHGHVGRTKTWYSAIFYHNRRRNTVR